MPNPILGHWYWHRVHNCPVYVREVARGQACYDILIVNGEWSSVTQMRGEVSEFDPWPLRGVSSESLIERR